MYQLLYTLAFFMCHVVIGNFQGNMNETFWSLLVKSSYVESIWKLSVQSLYSGLALKSQHYKGKITKKLT